MLGNTIGLLTLALMIASEGRNASSGWRYGLFSLAAVVALIAVALKPITDELPSVGTFLSGIFGNPVSWFILLIGLFFVFRPLWQRSSPSKAVPAAVAPGGARLVYETSQEEGLRKRLENIDQRIGTNDREVRAKLREIGESLTNSTNFARDNLATIYEALGAVYQRERLHILEADIEVRAAKLALPTETGATYDADGWDEWKAKYSEWKEVVVSWVAIAECYSTAIPDVLDVHPDQLQQKGVARVEQFPDPEAFILYKTFWLILKQAREARLEAERAVIQAAHNAIPKSGRPVRTGRAK